MLLGRPRVPLAAALLACADMGAEQRVVADSALPDYGRTGEAPAGDLVFLGSLTMNNLVTLWADAFKRCHPQGGIEIEGKGHAGAPVKRRWWKGPISFQPMSGDFDTTELETFRKGSGNGPTRLSGAFDTVAVYVHADNPIASLTLQPVDAIFSATQKGGAPRDLTTWGQLGLTGVPAVPFAATPDGPAYPPMRRTRP